MGPYHSINEPNIVFVDETKDYFVSMGSIPLRLSTRIDQQVGVRVNFAGYFFRGETLNDFLPAFVEPAEHGDLDFAEEEIGERENNECRQQHDRDHAPYRMRCGMAGYGNRYREDEEVDQKEAEVPVIQFSKKPMREEAGNGREILRSDKDAGDGNHEGRA